MPPSHRGRPGEAWALIHYGQEMHYNGAKDEECILEIVGMGPAVTERSGMHSAFCISEFCISEFREYCYPSAPQSRDAPDSESRRSSSPRPRGGGVRGRLCDPA